MPRVCFIFEGETLRVVICGDRNWRDGRTIERVIERLPPHSIVVHGDCRGADKMAGMIALRLGYFVIPVPANWAEYGKSAGPIRNQHMLTPRPDLVIAFHNDLRKSKGTIDMIMRANKAGINVEIYSSKSGIDNLTK